MPCGYSSRRSPTNRTARSASALASALGPPGETPHHLVDADFGRARGEATPAGLQPKYLRSGTRESGERSVARGRVDLADQQRRIQEDLWDRMDQQPIECRSPAPQ